MKICVISEARSSHTQRFTQKLAEMEHEVHLISSSRVDIPGVIFHCMPIYDRNPVKQYKNIRKIRKLFKDLNPDIYHLFGLFSVLSLGTMSLVNRLKPLIVSVWGSDIDSNANGFKINFTRRKILKQANLIIALSDHLAKKTLRFVNDADKVKVIHWGVSMQEFYSAYNKNQNNNKVVVGFAKRLYSLSAPDILLKGFARAQTMCKKRLVLHIAGQGEMEDELKQLVLDLDLTDSVQWMGSLKASEMLDFFQSIDILAMPSRMESLGMSAIEASACGVPVIATKIGGLPEIIEDNKTGLLIENEDIAGLAQGITALSEDSKRRRMMGRKACKRVKKVFNNDLLMKELLKLYQNVKS